MKKTIISVLIAAFAAISLISCSTTMQNRVTFHNDASGDISVNFRGEKYDIASGQKLDLIIHHKGTFSYATSFELPFGATSSVAEGALAGDLTINAGTSILVYYISSLNEGVYIISATVTTSDDLTAEDPNPIGP